MSPSEPVDYRYILANERTFLAYVRTALALQIAGLGTLQFLTGSSELVRLMLGVALVVVGSAVAVGGYLRWRSNDRAIRSGKPLESLSSAALLTAAVALVPLSAAVLVAVL